MLQAEGVWTGEERRVLVACLVVDDCVFDGPAWLNGQLACVWGPCLPGQASLKRKLEKKEKDARKKRKQDLGENDGDEEEEEGEYDDEEGDAEAYEDADWEPFEEAADDEQDALQPAKRRR